MKRLLTMTAAALVVAAPLPAPGEEDAGAMVIRCGNAASGQVALTFDDGPTGEHTPKVLEVLRKHRIKAAFFVTGLGARQHPHLIRAIAAAGHLVGNHSFHHPKRASLRAWRKQILLTEKAIRNAGVVPSRFYRPPYGIVTPRIRRLCKRLGYHIVTWSLMAPDFRRRPRTAKEIELAVLRYTTAGGVVVLHDGGGDRKHTVEALPAIIRQLSRKHTLVRLDRLLGPGQRNRNRCGK